MKILFLPAVLLLLPACTPPESQRPELPTSAKVIAVRVAPFTTAQGKAAKKVLVDWRNTGNTPIRVVYADITAFDAYGNVLDPGTINYTVFAVSQSQSGIAPGESYIAPTDEGFIWFPAPGSTVQAERANAVITKVETKSDI